MSLYELYKEFEPFALVSIHAVAAMTLAYLMRKIKPRNWKND